MITSFRVWVRLGFSLVRPALAGQTVMSISGEGFFINGLPTYAGQYWQGHKVQGLARLV